MITVNVALGDSLATIQGKLDSLPAKLSRLCFPDAGTFDFGSGTLRGRSNVRVLATAAVTINGTPGVAIMDFSGCSGWSVRGGATYKSFTFNAGRINATGAADGWKVANSIFNGQPSNGYDGAAIQMNGASFGSVANNDFNGVGGNVLGMYNLDNMTFDGNHFTNCWQPFSIQEPTGGNGLLGRNIVLVRNVFMGTQRAAIEVGPASIGAEYFSGLVVDNNFFDAFNPLAGAGCMLPISLVGQASINTTVTKNFIRHGSIHPEFAAPGIEFTGTGECTGNTVWGFAWGGFAYQSGWNFHDNTLYYPAGCPNYGAFVNNGSGSGTFGPENIVTSPPPVPAWPTRISW